MPSMRSRIVAIHIEQPALRETHVVDAEQQRGHVAVFIRDLDEPEDRIGCPEVSSRILVIRSSASNLDIERTAVRQTHQAGYADVDRGAEAPARLAGVAGLGGNGPPARRH